MQGYILFPHQLELALLKGWCRKLLHFKVGFWRGAVATEGAALQFRHRSESAAISKLGVFGLVPQEYGFGNDKQAHTRLIDTTINFL